MKLSEHFSLDELTFSQTAIRNGWENIPSVEVLDNLKRLCGEGLEPLRDFIGKPITITSGYRNLRLNKAIGSKDSSYHTKGLAADIIIKGMSVEQLMRAVIQSDIEFQQVILEFPNPDGTGGWVHFAIPALGQKPKMEKLIIDRNGVRLFDS